ncbi:hypothetical protein HanIR_Chr08g0353221 [Helianthus annuus]|nr:hypothetical protein HanIR_Chr08g0353221 [Helianthus annuus]
MDIPLPKELHTVLPDVGRCSLPLQGTGWLQHSYNECEPAAQTDCTPLNRRR